MWAGRSLKLRRARSACVCVCVCHLSSVKAATCAWSTVCSLPVCVHGALYSVAGAEEHWEDGGDGSGAWSSLWWGFSFPGFLPKPGMAFPSEERIEASPTLRGTRASMPCISDGCLPHAWPAGFKISVWKAVSKKSNLLVGGRQSWALTGSGVGACRCWGEQLAAPAVASPLLPLFSL